MKEQVKEETLKTVAGGEGNNPIYRIGDYVWLKSSSFNESIFYIENYSQSNGSWIYTGVRKYPSGNKEYNATVQENQIRCIVDNHYYIDNF